VSRLVLNGANLIDGQSPARRASVVIEGRRIAEVHDEPRAPVHEGDRVLDLGGRTLMPGMISCHFHATYHDLGSRPAPFGLEDPPALQAVRAARNLETLLRCGFTGAVSAGAPFAIDASMKQAIAQGLVQGPRLMAGSNDVSTTGHAGDKSFPWYYEIGARGAVHRCDGPAEFTKAVREEIKAGAEIIKMFVTGGHGTVAPKERLEMTREEMAAGIIAAHQRGAKVRGHIANLEAIHMALDLGMDVIDHGDGLDDEAIDRLVDTGTFLVPSQLFPRRFAESMGTAALGFTDDMQADVQDALDILPRANEAGVKLVLGDDYGALGLPHGCYADELAFYVEEAKIPPLDVIGWATKNGAELMGRGHELGTITEGKLADFLVVDGDPLADVRVLQNRQALVIIAKGGEMVVNHLDQGDQGR
jgi:imidazolonepropionase-like amidohydrolase